MRAGKGEGEGQRERKEKVEQHFLFVSLLSLEAPISLLFPDAFSLSPSFFQICNVASKNTPFSLKTLSSRFFCFLRRLFFLLRARLHFFPLFFFLLAPSRSPSLYALNLCPQTVRSPSLVLSVVSQSFSLEAAF